MAGLDEPRWPVSGIGGAGDLIETLGRDGRFRALLGVVFATGLGDLLQGAFPLTLIAPSDDAFSRLEGAHPAAAQPEDRPALARWLSSSVVPGRVALAPGSEDALITIEGVPLSLQCGSDGWYVGGARVMQVGLPADNGLIHVVDHVARWPLGPSE